MIETIIFLIVSFLGIFLASFWIQVIFFVDNTVKLDRTYLPTVTLLVPAFNEEEGIANTLDSLLLLDYPKEKLTVIVIDNGSTDRTVDIVKGYKGVKLLHEPKKGKACALNKGIRESITELTGCVDADSIVSRESLRNQVGLFVSFDVGAVISVIKIRQPKNLLEKVQHYEYILTAFVRKLMSTINTLYVTPGVLTVYRTKVLKQVGGFDENNNLTEDLEIALNLRYHHYKVLIQSESITYTNPPRTFWAFWRQRVRWFRGLIHNSIKYRKMFFNSDYGLLGSFQLPLIAVTQFVLIISFLTIAYHIFDFLYTKIHSLVLLKEGIFNLLSLPSLTEIIYRLNPLVLIPVLVSLIMGVYLMHKAHQHIKESWSYVPVLVFYFFLLPFLTALHWFWAIVLELTGARRRW